MKFLATFSATGQCLDEWVPVLFVFVHALEGKRPGQRLAIGTTRRILDVLAS